LIPDGEETVDPLDSAFDTFSRLKQDIATYDGTLVTEADARAKVIDPMFTQVLGWRGSELFAENATSSGFVDYVFTIDGRSRLIVEAKRDSRTLGIDNRDTGRGYILSGPAFKSEAASEGIEQAIRYCGSKNAELACVTNGRQWLIFRGNRLGDGTDTMRGMAYIFSTLDNISDNFKLFYRLLSRDDVERRSTSLTVPATVPRSLSG
jgi:predicted type IV restriction endonuclease